MLFKSARCWSEPCDTYENLHNLDTNSIMVGMTLKRFDKVLPSYVFILVKSYNVNVHYSNIKSVNSRAVAISQ